MVVRKIIALAFAATVFWVNSARADSPVCLLDAKEASGVSVISFATSQQIAAEICDRTYAAWNPSLVDAAGQVMAKSPSNLQIAEFLSYAESYARRRQITIADLFREVGQSLAHLRTQSLTREYCVEFSRTLARRLGSQDDLIGSAVLDAALAKGSGRICGTSEVR
jgi:hypothetical protein